MEFGNTLRAAREAKGYTISQLAQTTRVLAQVIEGLENENFKMIAAPIYGRGFVKLCCQALDLDPKPMVDEFMALYNGEKPTAAVLPATPAPEPETPPAPVPAPEPVPPEPAPVPTPTPEPTLFEPTAPEPPPAKPLSRFAPLTPTDDGEKGFSLPSLPIPWRLIFLIIAMVAVIWLLIVGGGALYRMLGHPTPEPNTPRQNAPAATGAPSDDTAAKAPRTPKPVKPLYID